MLFYKGRLFYVVSATNAWNSFWPLTFPQSPSAGGGHTAGQDSQVYGYGAASSGRGQVSRALFINEGRMEQDPGRLGRPLPLNWFAVVKWGSLFTDQSLFLSSPGRLLREVDRRPASRPPDTKLRKQVNGWMVLLNICFMLLGEKAFWFYV